MEDLTVWLSRELETRGWSLRELARRAKISPSSISQVLNGQYVPGNMFCRGIARAFQIPPEIVFRKAGLLPAPPQYIAKERELLDYFRYLNEQQQDDFLIQIRALHEAYVNYSVTEKNEETVTPCTKNKS